LDDVDADKARHDGERRRSGQLPLANPARGSPNGAAELTMTMKRDPASKGPTATDPAPPPAQRGLFLVRPASQGEARAEYSGRRGSGDAAHDEILQGDDIGHDDPKRCPIVVPWSLRPDSTPFYDNSWKGRYRRVDCTSRTASRSSSPADLDGDLTLRRA